LSVGTAFHRRTAALNRKLQWREWSGYYAASVYADAHDIEYNAIREAAALIDVSPLFKYEVSGRDAVRLIDRIITRDATKLSVNQVYYTPWCDEHGKVIDDGTVYRIDESRFRWTAADPSLRWFRQNAAGLDVSVDETSESTAALALQGRRARDVLEAATGEGFAEVRYFRGRPAKIGRISVDVTRTGYTGDLGYELWVDAAKAVALWDALMKAGSAHGIRPAGMLALDVARIEAGLILIEADFTSVRHAVIAEQMYSPFELGLGRMVSFDAAEFVGKRALVQEQAKGGPPRRLVGLEIEWDGIERMHAAQGLPPTVPAAASRAPVPVYAGRRQIGRVTSSTWSPTLKTMIALASVGAKHAETGTELWVEWTVEGRRGKVVATVVDLPFFDPPRKRA
jgi:glycine cleavage system T protein (aminomethyltransferase)